MLLLARIARGWGPWLVASQPQPCACKEIYAMIIEDLGRVLVCKIPVQGYDHALLTYSRRGTAGGVGGSRWYLEPTHLSSTKVSLYLSHLGYSSRCWPGTVSPGYLCTQECSMRCL